MHHLIRSGTLGLAALLSAGLSHAQAPAPAGELQSSVWQHHVVTLSYIGQTTSYTCDGLEEQVKSLLLYFGARKDLKVDATGCPRPDAPSHTAWVKADFYSLAAADSGASGSVPGQWSQVTIAPRRPSWMGAGECELVQQMKDLLTKSFSLRGMDYRTSCFPHQITLADYSVQGEVLKSSGKSG